MTDDATLSDFGVDPGESDDEESDSEPKPEPESNPDSDSSSNAGSNSDPDTDRDSDSNSDSDSSSGSSSAPNPTDEPESVDRTDAPGALETAAERERDGRPNASLSTYAWGDHTCSRCGSESERVWRDDGDFVCPDCKEW